MARPRNEDQPVLMNCLVAVIMPGIGRIQSIVTPVHRNEPFTVTRKEADALWMMGFAEEIEGDA